MPKCKYCGDAIEWRRLENGKWVPLDPKMPDVRHQCNFRRKIISVHCSKCNAWIEEESVEFVNIEEDFQGKDMLTFICPKCKTTQKSHRVG